MFCVFLCVFLCVCQICLQRKQARRTFHEKQKQLLQLLPPGEHTKPSHFHTPCINLISLKICVTGVIEKLWLCRWFVQLRFSRICQSVNAELLWWYRESGEATEKDNVTTTAQSEHHWDKRELLWYYRERYTCMHTRTYIYTHTHTQNLIYSYCQ